MRKTSLIYLGNQVKYTKFMLQVVTRLKLFSISQSRWPSSSSLSSSWYPVWRCRFLSKFMIVFSWHLKEFVCHSFCEQYARVTQDKNNTPTMTLQIVRMKFTAKTTAFHRLKLLWTRYFVIWMKIIEKETSILCKNDDKEKSPQRRILLHVIN